MVYNKESKQILYNPGTINLNGKGVCSLKKYYFPKNQITKFNFIIGIERVLTVKCCTFTSATTHFFLIESKLEILLEKLILEFLFYILLNSYSQIFHFLHVIFEIKVNLI